MRQTALEPEFVEFIPPALAEGKLYVSMTYATTVHLCACGCGNKVVLPLSPAEWQLLFDGESVSLNPSIGNWEFPCRSHSWIKRNEIKWAAAWSKKQIEAGRRRDLADLDTLFGGGGANSGPNPEPPARRRLRGWIRRRFGRR
jgi:hypothetical protein